MDDHIGCLHHGSNCMQIPISIFNKHLWKHTHLTDHVLHIYSRVCMASIYVKKSLNSQIKIWKELWQKIRCVLIINTSFNVQWLYIFFVVLLYQNMAFGVVDFFTHNVLLHPKHVCMLETYDRIVCGVNCSDTEVDELITRLNPGGILVVCSSISILILLTYSI